MQILEESRRLRMPERDFFAVRQPEREYGSRARRRKRPEIHRPGFIHYRSGCERFRTAQAACEWPGRSNAAEAGPTFDAWALAGASAAAIASNWSRE